MSDDYWVLEIIDDITCFAAQNDLPKIADMLADIQFVALQEIKEKRLSGSRNQHDQPPETSVTLI